MNPYSRLSATVLKGQPAAAAHVLENFPAESVAHFLASASPVTAAGVIGHVTPGFAAACLAALEPATACRILDPLPQEHQVTLLRQLRPDERESLLHELPAEFAAALRRLLPYPEGTAGALMEAPLARVPEGVPVRDALKRIKRIRRGMKFYLYATNAMGQLTGVLTLHELLNAPPGGTVSQVMHRPVVSLSPGSSTRAVLDSPYWQEYHALPVTDRNQVLLGVIRQKSLRRFEEQAVQTGALSGGLGTVIAAGELFSGIATQVLSALITAGTSLGRRESP